MANIKTYDILQCSRLYPTINGANNAAFDPFIDQIVQINGDEQQSYTVKENIQARFFAPQSADGTSNVQYSVTSILFNGLECLSADANLTVEEADNIYIEFPLYLSNPTGYDNNVATAVITEQSLTPTAFFERNLIDFLQGLFSTLDIPVDVVNSHPDWWAVDAFPSMRNFMLELYSSDSISMTIEETYNGVTRVLTYDVSSAGAVAYINGDDVTTIPVPANEEPQFGDVYSINSFPVTVDSIEAIDCCPVVDPFYASLKDECCSTLDVNCDCDRIRFSDTSNYDNGLLGHDPSFFNHRTIVLTKPDGTEYVWSTDGTVGQPPSNCGCAPITAPDVVVNEIIQPHFNSTNIFEYNFTDADRDGIYAIKICTYPDWQDSIYYDSALNYFVYRNGVVYKQVASSTGIDPELDADNNFWVVASEDDDRGRYCSTERVVILCISILDCYRKTVEEALCSIKFNPCKDMCDNKAFMKAMKIRVTLDAVGFATCEKKWALVKDHIDILKDICCCNG